MLSGAGPRAAPAEAVLPRAVLSGPYRPGAEGAVLDVAGEVAQGGVAASGVVKPDVPLLGGAQDLSLGEREQRGQTRDRPHLRGQTRDTDPERTEGTDPGQTPGAEQ